MSILLKAQPVTEALYSKLAEEVREIQKKLGRPPTLATVLVGQDPASQIYVRKKQEMCVKLGMGHKDFKLSETTAESEMLEVVKKLNQDSSIDGILVQSPLPKQIDEKKVFSQIDYHKDVDCFSPYNVGLLVQNQSYLLPCTPAGVMEILHFYKIDVAGKNALVVGRSDIVGKPMGLLLLHANATVTIAHSKTQNLSDLISRADIVVAAVGRAHFLQGDLNWKKDSVVIDVGINRDQNGKLCGDVEFDQVSKQVKAITPVPGGVGPTTIAMLMKNTVNAAKKRISS